MRLRPVLRFWRALLATNVKASFALRGAFWLQAAFMLVNDAVWFSMWGIFFARFPQVAGWSLADLAVLQGVLALAFGLSVLAGGGMGDIARAVVEGGLDAFLTQPKPALLHIVASRTVASGWGDVVFGVGLLLAVRGSDPVALAAAALGAGCGAAVLVSAGVLFQSTAFWAGDVQALARSAWEFVVAFSSYPEPLFAGALRLALFTVIPAGFVAWVPAALVRGFGWATLGLLAAGTAVFVFAAVFVFRRGLARYASGNRFGVRA